MGPARGRHERTAVPETSPASAAPETPAPAGQAARRRPLLMKQPIMWRVLYALAPVAVSGVYFFGWRVVALVAVCNAAGFATEFLMARGRGRPATAACFVTGTLYALSLPPTMPFWMAAVGVMVGILFGKEVFGGFGRNFANPAIVGRAFVYVCFPVALTGSFVPAFKGWPGGLVHWSFTSLERLPAYLAETGQSVVDAVSAVSPMWAFRDFGHVPDAWPLATGAIGGAFETEYGTQILAAGSIGEGCAILLVAAGVYLMVTKTSNWRLTVAALAGAGLAQGLLWLGGATGAQPLWLKLLAGAFLYVAVFMVTDPVSAPRKPLAMWAYGGLIGLLIVLISWKSQFIAAASFSILLGNIFSPLLDRGAAWWEARRKAGKAAPEGGGGAKAADASAGAAAGVSGGGAAAGGAG